MGLISVTGEKVFVRLYAVFLCSRIVAGPVLLSNDLTKQCCQTRGDQMVIVDNSLPTEKCECDLSARSVRHHLGVGELLSKTVVEPTEELNMVEAVDLSRV